MDRNLLISLQTSKAHRILDGAEEMVDLRHWAIAANRYYYACFHMLQALFISRGIPAKSHEGTLTQLKINQEFAKIVKRIYLCTQIRNF